ncbi:hypothetical protein, partial [Listeria welshimeri]|uniref:hypothetical protein n=1 Tax=Listeria welshimeri TaxID=1643 RepID=UPI001E3E5549
MTMILFFLGKSKFLVTINFSGIKSSLYVGGAPKILPYQISSQSGQPFLRLARTNTQTNRQTDKQTNRQTDKNFKNHSFGFGNIHTTRFTWFFGKI